MRDDEHDDMYQSDSDDGDHETVCGGGSGLTEVQNGGDAAAGNKARCGCSDCSLTEEAAAAHEIVPCSPIRIIAARCGCLLLGFFAGGIVAALWLFLKAPGRPEQWIVPT